MTKKMMYIFTQTPMHIGAGNEVGVIDNPIQRDKITSAPIIPGSSLKGVFRRECAFKMPERDISDIFGYESDKGAPDGKLSAGKLSFTEASLLLFPLRSLKNGYAYATSPYLLKKFLAKSGKSFSLENCAVQPAACVASQDMELKDAGVMLEEYSFARLNNPELLSGVSALIANALPNIFGKEDLVRHLVILSDEDMFYFAQYTCPVQQHVRIGEKGVAVDGALFNIEVVPADTLMYSMLIADNAEVLDKFSGSFGGETLLQFGSDSTTGLGYSLVSIEK